MLPSLSQKIYILTVILNIQLLLLTMVSLLHNNSKNYASWLTSANFFPFSSIPSTSGKHHFSVLQSPRQLSVKSATFKPTWFFLIDKFNLNIFQQKYSVSISPIRYGSSKTPYDFRLIHYYWHLELKALTTKYLHGKGANFHLQLLNHL